MRRVRRILVVEDDPASRHLVCEVLRHGGFASVTAADGEAALAVARETLPDLVIMDVRLPGALDGIAVTRLLRADPRTRTIPVVALSAPAHHTDQATALEAGCDRYMTKPVRYRDLLAVIEELLGRPRA